MDNQEKGNFIQRNKRLWKWVISIVAIFIIAFTSVNIYSNSVYQKGIGQFKDRDFKGAAQTLEFFNRFPFLHHPDGIVMYHFIHAQVSYKSMRDTQRELDLIPSDYDGDNADAIRSVKDLIDKSLEAEFLMQRARMYMPPF